MEEVEPRKVKRYSSLLPIRMPAPVPTTSIHLKLEGNPSQQSLPYLYLFMSLSPATLLRRHARHLKYLALHARPSDVQQTRRNESVHLTPVKLIKLAYGDLCYGFVIKLEGSAELRYPSLTQRKVSKHLCRRLACFATSMYL
jgi:hypothetical protein